jgi:hypothetical protein
MTISTTLYIKYHYAVCRDLFIVMLSVVMLSVIGLRVVAPKYDLKYFTRILVNSTNFLPFV